MECKSQVKQLRESRGMTQRQLADRLNVSPAAVALWETGTNKPSMKNAVRLADILNCSIDALFGRDDSERGGEGW